MLVHGRTLQALAAVVLVLGAATSCSGGSQAGQQTRDYYIAADEVAWNYAPAGTNVFTGAPSDDEANKFVQAGPNRIGSTYMTRPI
jgi:hephaestin